MLKQLVGYGCSVTFIVGFVLMPAYSGCPGKKAFKLVSVSLSVCLLHQQWLVACQNNELFPLASKAWSSDINSTLSYALLSVFWCRWLSIDEKGIRPWQQSPNIPW